MITKESGISVDSYYGLSGDTKPGVGATTTAHIKNGSTFFEMDTSKCYMYDAQGKQWHLLNTSSVK